MTTNIMVHKICYININLATCLATPEFSTLRIIDKYTNLHQKTFKHSFTTLAMTLCYMFMKIIKAKLIWVVLTQDSSRSFFV